MANIDIFDKAVIDRVIQIVNNLTYKKTNMSTAEIDKTLKKQLKEYFVDFFGEQHRNVVSQRIDSMGICRCFQVIGAKNSISQFLLDFKSEVFNNGKRTKLKNPETLEFFATTPIDEIIRISASNSKSMQRLEDVCAYLGLRKENLKTPNGQTSFRCLVTNAFQEYKNTPFSLNPLKNEQMLFLNEYVNLYRQYIKNEYISSGLSLADYENRPLAIQGRDPVYRRLTEQMPKVSSTTIAYCPSIFFDSYADGEAFQNGNNIFLGINPTGDTIIHETFHRVTTNGKTKQPGIQNKDKYKYFNEVVTEYYSQMIHNKMLSIQGEDLTANMEKENSAYEALFDGMKPFLKTFSPEFKEILLRDDPTADMKYIIGSENFETIANCCDIIFRYGYEVNCNQMEKALQDLKLYRITQETRLRKSPLARIFNAISRNAGMVANKINSLDFDLCKLGGAIYSLTDFINRHTQQSVRKNLLMASHSLQGNSSISTDSDDMAMQK